MHAVQVFFGTFRGRGFPITSEPWLSSAGEIPRAPPEPAQLPSELARLVAESIAEKQQKEQGSTPPLGVHLPAKHAKQVPGGSLERDGDGCPARTPGCPAAEGSAGNSRQAAASDSPLASSVRE